MSQANVISDQAGLSDYHFFVRKLHSALGLFPIGIFLLEHLITNSLAAFSPALYDKAIAHLMNLPYLGLIEILIIALPLTIHAIYGLYIVYVTKNNIGRYAYVRNWMFYLQRISALITFAFVLVHVWQLRVAHALYGLEISYVTVQQLLAQPFWLTFYIISLLAATFHFSNGLWNFSVSWGIVIGEQSQQFLWKLCMLFFIITSILGLSSIWAFIQ